MNFGIRKLFSSLRTSQSSQSNFYQHLTIPARKKMIDALYLFEEAIDSKKINSDASFDQFCLGYMFSVDNLLNRFANIQRYFSSHGIFGDEILRFGEEVKKTKSDVYIHNLFKETSFEKNEIMRDVFTVGYKMAEENIQKICFQIYFDSKKLGMTDYMTYTYFWDFAASELIEMPVGIAKSYPDMLH